MLDIFKFLGDKMRVVEELREMETSTNKILKS